jgi:hypothetical protein
MPAPGTLGNLGRNALHGPNLAQPDLTVDKAFRSTEHKNVQIRADFYNILNHPNFAYPSGGQPRLNNALGVGSAFIQPGQPFTKAARQGAASA